MDALKKSAEGIGCSMPATVAAGTAAKWWSTAAVHFSLMSSCKRHGHDPFVYLRDVLMRLPTILPSPSADDLDALLPHRWHPT